jgi:hypothetical protein
MLAKEKQLHGKAPARVNDPAGTGIMWHRKGVQDGSAKRRQEAAAAVGTQEQAEATQWSFVWLCSCLCNVVPGWI